MNNIMMTIFKMSFYSTMAGTVIFTIRFFIDKIHIPKLTAYYLWFYYITQPEFVK